MSLPMAGKRLFSLLLNGGPKVRHPSEKRADDKCSASKQAPLLGMAERRCFAAAHRQPKGARRCTQTWMCGRTFVAASHFGRRYNERADEFGLARVEVSSHTETMRAAEIAALKAKAPVDYFIAAKNVTQSSHRSEARGSDVGGCAILVLAIMPLTDQTPTHRETKTPRINAASLPLG